MNFLEDEQESLIPNYDGGACRWEVEISHTVPLQAPVGVTQTSVPTSKRYP